MPATNLNRVIDALDAITGAETPDDAWLRADGFARKIGASALNVSEIERQSGQVVWFRSSMETAWLVDYLEQGFLAIDPLVVAARQGHSFAKMQDGRLPGFQQMAPGSRALRDQLISWNHPNLDSYGMATEHADTVKIVSLSQAHDASMPTRTERLLAAVIGTAVRAPQSSQSPGATPFQPPDLSDRERDILSHLAAGLRNDMIAWKLGIAEVTVRAHVQSARRKLGAATREQAIASALRKGLLSL